MPRLLATAALAATFVVSSCNCDDEVAPIIDRGAVRGLICADGDGQPAAGLFVTITDNGGAIFEATTDGAGGFLTEKLEVGIATLVISDPSGDRTGTILVSKDVITQFTDGSCRAPPPPPQGTVDGCICDEAVGQWVTGANVFVSLPSGDVAAAVTDENGCFSLGGLPDGTFQLNVQKGVFSESHSVAITVGSTTSLPAVASCEPPVVPENAGAVAGRVCAPDGETWLSGADVFIELADGTRVQVTTDGDGRYNLAGVPAGRHTLHVVKGSFTSESQVDVFADQTTTIPEGECAIEAVNLRVAVVTGNFDHVQDVLTTIGVQPDRITLYESSFGGFSTWVDELVLAPGVLEQYDIVFLNCGLADTKFFGRFRSQPAIDRLRQFVADGGSVYSSDYAYNIVEAVWPDFIDFLGDEAPDAAKFGFTPFDITANITDASMALALGQNTMALHYPYPGSNGWVVMESVSPQTTVYVRADAETYENGTLTNVPHTVAFRPGAGRVLFTSFHQEPGINPDMQRILQLLMFEL